MTAGGSLPRKANPGRFSSWVHSLRIIAKEGLEVSNMGNYRVGGRVSSRRPASLSQPSRGDFEGM